MAGSSLAHIDWFELDREISELPQGQRCAYVDQVARQFGVSHHTIRRQIRNEFGKKKMVEREPTAATPERAEMVWEMKALGISVGDREIATEIALQMLADRGHAWASEVSVSAMNVALRRYGYRDEKCYMRIEADHACQQFQMDFSRSKYFQAKKPMDDGDWLLVVRSKEMHYKTGDARLRTWLTQFVDAYSRLQTIRYAPATGEGRLLGIGFLDWYFNRSEDAHLMRHVPELVQSDGGAFLKGQEGRSALSSIDVPTYIVPAGNKETQGKIERGFRTLWQRFELPLAVDLLSKRGEGATILLSELNAAVNEFTIREHDREHPRLKGQARGELYQQSILRHRPKVVDSDVYALAFREEERRVDAFGMVSLDGLQLEAPKFAVGKMVRVWYNMDQEFVAELIDGYRDQPFRLTPAYPEQLDHWQKAPHVTLRERMQRKVESESKIRALTHRAEKVQPQNPFIETAKYEKAKVAGFTLLEARAEIGRSLRAARRSDIPASIIPQLLQGLEDRGNIYDGIDRADVQNIIATLISYQQTRKAI